MPTSTTGESDTIVVSALRARANFGKLLSRVEDERRSLVIRKGVTIATGATQNECGCNAKRKYPNDPILTGRVENTNQGNPDHSRRLYPEC